MEWRVLYNKEKKKCRRNVGKKRKKKRKSVSAFIAKGELSTYF